MALDKCVKGGRLPLMVGMLIWTKARHSSPEDILRILQNVYTGADCNESGFHRWLHARFMVLGLKHTPTAPRSVVTASMADGMHHPLLT